MIDFGAIQMPGMPGSGAARNTGNPGASAGPSSGRSGLPDDPAAVRDLLLNSPHDLALLKERNPPLAEALLSGDLGREVLPCRPGNLKPWSYLSQIIDN